MQLQDILQTIGFKDKKQKVYLACLELGQANAQKIAKAAGVERTSVYALLDALKQEGLISATVKRKTKYFIPEPPQKLIDGWQNKVKALEKALPLFLSIYNTSNIKPKIRFYEDREGIKEIFKDTLNCQEKQLRNLSSAKDILELLGKTFIAHYIDQRVEKGVKIKSLRPHGKEPDYWYLKADNKEVLRTSRFLPKGISFNVVCLIYDNKVAVISSKKESFGFVIESREFSDLMKILYDLIWKMSKEVP